MKVLISAYTGLGNFILKTPMINKIKELYPDCTIDIIAGNSFGTEFVLKNSNLINNTLLLPENCSLLEKISFFRKLRKEKYDAVFLSFDANSKFLFFGSFLAGIKKRVVHVLLRNKLKSIFFLLSPKTLVVPQLQGRHEIDLNYDLLEFFYNKPFTRKYQTIISNTKDNNVLKKFELNKNKYFVLQIGAANGVNSSKKWSKDNFTKLINQLKILYPTYNIVTVGDKGDYENDIKQLEDKNLEFVNTAGLTSIDEVSNILYYSKLVISNDSGIMHIANALQCHLIALYGPTDYTRTRPLGKKSNILYSKTGCFCKMYNFSGNESEILKQYPNCMDNIKVEHVLNKIKLIINGDKYA